MAGGGTRRRRRSSMRGRRGGSKLGGCGAGNDDIVMNSKLGNRIYGEWISVRGHRIRRSGRMRVDSNGDMYVPYSEDEESGMDVGACGLEVADLEAAPVNAGSLQMADGIAGDDVDAAMEGIPANAVEVAAEGSATDGVKLQADSATGEEMQPEVAARLKMLLANMDPTYWDVFVNMYKPTKIIRQHATT